MHTSRVDRIRTADSRISLRVRDFLEVGHDGAFVRSVDDIVGARGQGVAPGELCGGSGLDVDDGVGLLDGAVGATVAGDVGGGDVLDGLDTC